MLKMKSKSAVTKRVKRTKSGKLLRSAAYTSHLAPRKTTKQKRQLRNQRLVSKSDLKRYTHLIQK